MFDVANCSVSAIIAYILHSLIIRNLDFIELYASFPSFKLYLILVIIEKRSITKNSLQPFGSQSFFTLSLPWWI